jgi:hypothetical protein
VPSGCGREKGPKHQLTNDWYNEKMAAAKQTSGGKNVNFARLWEDAKLETDKKTPQRREKKEQKPENENKDVDKLIEGEAVE